MAIETQQRRLAAGQCPDCGDPPEPGKTLCRKHRDRKNAAMRQLRAKRRGHNVRAHRRPWNETEDATLRECKLRGMSNIQIGRFMHRTTTAINMRLMRLGLTITNAAAKAAIDNEPRWPYPPLRIEDFIRSGLSTGGL